MNTKKGYKKYKGCTEDCLNCPYPDCYKPDYLFKADKGLKQALKKQSTAKSNLYRTSTRIRKVIHG